MIERFFTGKIVEKLWVEVGVEVKEVEVEVGVGVWGKRGSLKRGRKR